MDDSTRKINIFFAHNGLGDKIITMCGFVTYMYFCKERYKIIFNETIYNYGFKSNNYYNLDFLNMPFKVKNNVNKSISNIIKFISAQTFAF